nr:hypothetical protein Iba_scaffold15375CG0020 [Ipomoea batatas]
MHGHCLLQTSLARQQPLHTLFSACATNSVCKLRMPIFFFCSQRFTRNQAMLF